jgi:translation initiation factor IF-1
MMMFLRPSSSKVVFPQQVMRWKFSGYADRRRLPESLRVDDNSPVMPDATIHTLGRILETRGPVLYRISLPNGKTLLAHLSKPLADAGAEFAVGDEVLVEMTPDDFDTARILRKSE